MRLKDAWNRNAPDWVRYLYHAILISHNNAITHAAED